jgi:hypothetical protein
MLRIHCSGLTTGEVKELQSLIQTQSGVDDVQYQPDFSGIQRRSMPMAFVSPEFWILVKMAAPAVSTAAVIAGKTMLEEASKDVYKRTREWVNQKFLDKTSRNIEVTLYGPNDRLIEKIEK